MTMSSGPGRLTVDPPGVLVVADDATAHVDLLARQFGGAITLHGLADVSRLDDALKALQPSVVVSAFHSRWRREHASSVYSAPSVEWLHHFGSGMDLFGSPPARLALTNSAGVLSQQIAEYVIGSLMMVMLKWPDHLERQSRREWAKVRRDEIAGKELLVVGLGHIGKRVALLGRAIGLKVRAVRSRASEAPEVDRVFAATDLADAVSTADFISIHMPLTPSTAGLFDAKILGHFKSSAVLVNTARGGIVDNDALASMLREKRLRAAILDVLPQEPLPADSPLWETPNLFITPHCSQTVTGNLEKLVAFFADNMERFLRGESLLNAHAGHEGHGQLA